MEAKAQKLCVSEITHQISSKAMSSDPGRIVPDPTFSAVILHCLTVIRVEMN